MSVKCLVLACRMCWLDKYKGTSVMADQKKWNDVLLSDTQSLNIKPLHHGARNKCAWKAMTCIAGQPFNVPTLIPVHNEHLQCFCSLLCVMSETAQLLYCA